jgi:hypothetical protein
MLANYVALEHDEIGVTRAEVELAGKFNISNLLPRIKSITHGERAQRVKLLKMGQHKLLPTSFESQARELKLENLCSPTSKPVYST